MSVNLNLLAQRENNNSINSSLTINSSTNSELFLEKEDKFTY